MTFKKTDQRQHSERLFREAEKHEDAGDFRDAFKCLLAAARLGHVSSQLNLGNFYSSGRGVRKSLDNAARWYKRAYKSGKSDGALNLGIDRRNQGNVRSAVIWFKKAAAMHNGDAYIELAKIYAARKDDRKAASGLLRRALRLNRDRISDLAKEEARSLLKTLNTQG